MVNDSNCFNFSLDGDSVVACENNKWMTATVSIRSWLEQLILSSSPSSGLPNALTRSCTCPWPPQILVPGALSASNVLMIFLHSPVLIIQNHFLSVSTVLMFFLHSPILHHPAPLLCLSLILLPWIICSSHHHVLQCLSYNYEDKE